MKIFASTLSVLLIIMYSFRYFNESDILIRSFSLVFVTLHLVLFAYLVKMIYRR